MILFTRKQPSYVRYSHDTGEQNDMLKNYDKMQRKRAETKEQHQYFEKIAMLLKYSQIKHLTVDFDGIAFNILKLVQLYYYK